MTAAAMEVFPALGQIPERPGRVVDLTITGWRDEQHQVFRAACETLEQVWPEMLAELSAVVRQVALLDGWGIDGYTDFTVHGAIFVNNDRLRAEPDGLAAHLRLAEALIHEGTHNRCDAAAAADPFLAPAGAGAGPVLRTPLRTDPRPLSGLFQQVIVLARSVLFYDRLPATAPIRARREHLLRQGLQGAATLRSQVTNLTEHGRTVAEEADADGRRVQLFSPFDAFPGLVFGRTAARSAAFPANDAAGGERVLIGSAAGSDGEDVAVRAKGELSERVHNVLAGRHAEAGSVAGAVVATYEMLHRSGRPALDPLAWHELAHCHEVRSARLLWVTGRSLTSDDDVLIPACAAFLAHRPPAGCVAPLRPGSTGTAAHRTCADAVAHAVLEVLERDLLWHAWYGDGARVAMTGDPPLSPQLADGLRALGLSATVLLLPGPGGTACALACLHHAGRTEQSFGARATPAVDGDALGRAVEAAVHEALMVRWSMGSPAALSAWQWMRAAGPNVASGPLEHALHTFHRQDSLAHLLAGSTRRPWPDPAVGGQSTDLTSGTEVSAGRLLADRTGAEVAVVDTTVPAMDPAGAVVVRVVAPGARRLPADEHAQPPPAEARTRLPHPLG